MKPYRVRTAKYCSNICRKVDKTATIITLECLTCAKPFTREKWKQSNSHKGSYCSRRCYTQRSPQQEIECICGKRFRAHQSRISYYHRLFCGRQCYLKNGFFGRLTDDIPEMSNYGKFVASLRSTALYLQWKQTCLDRDEHRCILCFKEENLTVHHKVSIYQLVRKHGLNKEKIEKDPIFFNTINGETLCRSCHLNTHRKEINE